MNALNQKKKKDVHAVRKKFLGTLV